MYTLLFVDDQPEILHALRRSLFQRMENWDIHIACSGTEALQMMEAISFDVVVTDIKMPRMNGAELLEVIAEKHPSSIRFILSGYTERKLVYRTIGNVHQFLSKPLDTELIIESIQKAIDLKEQLLPENIQDLVNGLKNLPSMPSIYTELMDALCTSNVSLSEISQIVQKDIALTARVMHLVNSSFFGNPVYVNSPSHAVSLLGTEVMKGLVMSSYAFSAFKNNKAELFCLDAFERHCFQVGSLAKRIAEEESNNPVTIDDSLIAGLLHDIGMLLLAALMPETYDELYDHAVKEGLSILDIEKRELHTTHAEIGAYLLGTWGFRSNIVEAIAYQYIPQKSLSNGFNALTAVHVANQLLNCTNTGGECTRLDVDEIYLNDIGLLHRLGHWKSLRAHLLDNQINDDRTNIIC